MADDQTVSFTSAQIEVIRAGVRTRAAALNARGLRGLDRIEIEVTGPLAYVARNPHEAEGMMAIGEPVARGGVGSGNSPLSHFLTGAASCLLNQFIRLAVADGLPLSFSGARVRGEFRREPGGAFERIATEVIASGHIDETTAATLVERAEAFCYVHNTLRRSVAMTTTLVVDGRVLVAHESAPS